MSDVVATPEASVVVDATSAKSPAPAPTSVAKGEPEEKPSWLDARLERERRSLLKDVGAESLDTLRKDLAELNAAREAKKTDAQKAADLEAQMRNANARLEETTKALSLYAENQMKALTDAQRDAIAAVAGDDPAKQLTMIEKLRPTWASQAAPAAPVQTKETPKDTAPAPSAPKDGSAGAPPDVKAIHAELKKTNPVLAARYAIANGVFE